MRSEAAAAPVRLTVSSVVFLLESPAVDGQGNLVGEELRDHIAHSHQDCSEETGAWDSPLKTKSAVPGTPNPCPMGLKIREKIRFC